MTLKVKKVCAGAVIPTRATQGSAGYDLCACIPEAVIIPCGQTRKIPTGIAVEMENSCMAGMIYARSGLGIKHGVIPANAVGVIDSDYRGEIIVGLHNHSEKHYVVQPGERIAQLVFLPVLLPDIAQTDTLDDTERGEGGLGSTGK